MLTYESFLDRLTDFKERILSLVCEDDSYLPIHKGSYFKSKYNLDKNTYYYINDEHKPVPLSETHYADVFTDCLDAFLQYDVEYNDYKYYFNLSKIDENLQNELKLFFGDDTIQQYNNNETLDFLIERFAFRKVFKEIYIKLCQMG